MTELTFALLKYGFLVLLWVFVGMAVRSLHRDVSALSPRPGRSHRLSAPLASEPSERERTPIEPHDTNQLPAQRPVPTLLVVIDGPLAGSSVPLNAREITLGRAASNTVVLDDEFVSTHHARVIQDPASGQWAIEDLNSTNGTVVGGRRISEPTILPARIPVRIGATTFELR